MIHILDKIFCVIECNEVCSRNCMFIGGLELNTLCNNPIRCAHIRRIKEDIVDADRGLKSDYLHFYSVCPECEQEFIRLGYIS